MCDRTVLENPLAFCCVWVFIPTVGALRFVKPFCNWQFILVIKIIQ